MGTSRSIIRSLLASLSLLALACEDADSPLEPSLPPVAAATPAASAGAARWAAGYLHAGAPTTASYSPVAYLSYNASGGTMNVTKPAGTTGRYIVTFRGLSAVLGTKSTVHVTEYGLDDTYCKPVNGKLVSDKLEVRCFRASTRAAANAAFTVVVLARQSNAVFAYAHQPTATGYAASAGASYNPAGATTVYRESIGVYRVTFSGHAKSVPAGVSGHPQANAVGTGKANCMAEDWGTSYTTDVSVWVHCYSPSGTPTDTKFTVLYQLPTAHLAYIYAAQSSTASYSPYPPFAYNPSGGGIEVTRTGVGDYRVVWTGIDSHVIEGGTVQVTSVSEAQQCKATSLFESGVMVHCFGPSGAPVDAMFTALLGS